MPFPAVVLPDELSRLGALYESTWVEVQPAYAHAPAEEIERARMRLACIVLATANVPSSATMSLRPSSVAACATIPHPTRGA